MSPLTAVPPTRVPDLRPAYLGLGPLNDEVGELIRNKDWSTTPLGPIEDWSPTLRMAAGICLQSRFPMLIWWGPEMVMLYNQAYRPMLGDKHPRSLGQDGRECWAEIWPVIGPLLDGVRQRGEASWSEDQVLIMERYGFVEETYFTFSYSPIRDERGAVAGVYTAVTETTDRVIGERRLNTLRQLSLASRQNDAASACGHAADVLAANPLDLPFALLYLADDDGHTARLVGSAGLARGSSLAPVTVELGRDGASYFPIGGVLRSGHQRTVAGVPSDVAHTAVVLPIPSAGRSGSAGVMVAGVSLRRPLDRDYESFLQLAAGHVGTAVGNAQAYEAERRRAEALAEIDRAKTAFFSNVSHEFRTPLTLMLGPLEQAIAQGGPDRENLAVAHRNSLRQLKLVNSLLDFSRIEAGRIDASYEPTELGTFTTELASLFRSATERAGLSFTVDCPPLPEPVFVDRDMWEKIVFNLLSNALKFTFEGEIAIRLRAQPAATLRLDPHVIAATPPPMITLEVQDTGTGIPAEELPRIFDRFHRVRHARSRSHEGTGIGLALVQELTRLHGGRVAVASEVGAGTTFTITIPLGSSHLPAEKVTGGRPRTPSGATAVPFIEEALRWMPGAQEGEDALPAYDNPTTVRPHVSAAGARLVLADDNADMRDYVRRLLVARGYDVTALGDGIAALAAVRQLKPALVLSDIMMPRLDGIGVLQALRQDPATETVPVILLTARAGEDARIEGAAAGADDYLTKPFSARELLARVETHLELAAARAAASAAVESARQRLYDVFMLSPAMVCVLRGPQHTFELANPAYLRVIGRTHPEQLIGKPIRVALPELEDQGYFEVLDRVYATGDPHRGEESKVRLARAADGGMEDVYVNFVYLPTRNATNAVDGVLVHAVDVTPQVRSRQAAEELATERKRAEEKLEVTVAERTAKLRETIGELEAFSYSIAHDLRAPLRALQGFSDVLLNEHAAHLNAEAQGFLRRISAAGARMDRLILDVLNYSRLVRGEAALDRVDVARLLSDIVETYPQFGPEHVEVVIEGNLTPVVGNEAMLTQVFSNLLGNAVKFVAPGVRPRIRIRGETVERSARVYLQDNGIGIDASQHAKIFEIFQQVETGRGGTGIGLAIVKKAVARMGGRVGVISAPDQGSTFWIELPAA